MRFIATLFAAGLMACTAHAQFGREERSQSEIIFEQAEANMAKQRADRSEAIRGCSRNDYDACFKLGDSYRRGAGGPQDYKQSATAYRKACSGNSGAGCASLAYLFVGGKGMDVDLAQARHYYKKACDLDEVSGCAAYGNLLFTGKGGSKNVIEGTKFLTDACTVEYQWACDRIVALGAYDSEDNTWDRLKDWKTRSY